MSQITPEAGTVDFAYDNNGNLTSSSNQNLSNNTTQYQYDALNRLTSMIVGGGPTYTYTYDAQDSSGDPYGKGRLTSTSNGSNVQTAWQHDPLGRVTSTSYCLPSNCSGYNVQSSYDFQNNLTHLTYPDGRQIQWQYNNLNLPTSETFAQWGSTPVNTSYVANLSYYPAGQMQQATFGNGVQVGTTYDPDQNISSLAYVANGSPIVEKTYTWDKNAINLLSISDVASGRTQTYQYDQLNRITSVVDSGTTTKACNTTLPDIPAASQTYSIDSWGNLQQSGSYSFSQLIGASNQITSGGYQYDSAGNQTRDGLGNTYQYRADGLMSSSNGYTYTYDALGQRVRKDGSLPNEYFYFGGQLLAIRNPNTSAWMDRIYGPSGTMATVPGTQNSTPIYRALDHLGSLNYLMDSAGNISGVVSTLPYGQTTSNTAGDNFLFTDHERDSENGSDATQYRHYSSAQGRWLSPDPSNGSYNLLDPQSLNRYAYLTGRPMGKIDRLGLDDDDDDDDDGGWWSGDDDDDDGGGWGPPPSYIGDQYGGSDPAGTTGPGDADGTINVYLSVNGSTDGVADGAWGIVEFSTGLDQDGMAEIPDGLADFPMAQAIFHGSQSSDFVTANTIVDRAAKWYATQILSIPLMPLTSLAFETEVESSIITVNSGAGGGSLPWSLVRTVGQDGLTPEIVNELKSLAWETGNEHALVTLGTGENAIVSGGPEGIEFEEGDITNIMGHTHPEWNVNGLNPSEGDMNALRQLNQESSYIYWKGLVTKFGPMGIIE
ncbi:MAG TPA: RHS repeat-associated core domain-containing protein [Terracidiphilus sp.]|nr:RHS repeat-associated core domain-containing protein [Terracidiphilus sp.]